MLHVSGSNTMKDTDEEAQSKPLGIASAVEGLLDSSTIAAAIAEPEEFLEEFCGKKRVERRRPKVRHKATCKEKTTSCVKRTCVYMLSYIGLTCIVVGYSIIGGLVFPYLEGKHEEIVKQKAIGLRDKYSADLELNISKDIGMFSDKFTRNTSKFIIRDIHDNMQRFQKDVTEVTKKQMVQLVKELLKTFGRNNSENAQERNSSRSSQIKSEKRIEDEVQAIFRSLSDNLIESTTKFMQQKIKETVSSFGRTIRENRNESKMFDAMFQTFQMETYELVNREGWAGVDTEEGGEGKWTLAGGLLYSVTVITTIGYGTITPKTDAGKAITIVYALIGIPLTILCITNIGRGMASFFRAIYGGTFCVDCRRQFFHSMRTHRLNSIAADDIELDKVDPGSVSDLDSIVIHEHAEVPMLLGLLLVAWYIAFGAIMFKLWEENWTIFEGAYFCFITLSTIGFGDIVPGFSDKDWDNQVKQIACSLYLLIGLSTLAMCFDLMQQRGKQIASNFAKFIGLVKREDRVVVHRSTSV